MQAFSDCLWTTFLILSNILWPFPNYTRDRNVFSRWFLAGNQVNHQNFDPSLLTNNLWRVFMRIRHFFFFLNFRLKKIMFFKIANSQNLFVKISWIGLWVSRIDWFKRHWCISTYMAVRLSDIRPKTAKKQWKCIFYLFSSYVGQPHDQRSRPCILI